MKATWIPLILMLALAGCHFETQTGSVLGDRPNISNSTNHSTKIEKINTTLEILNNQTEALFANMSNENQTFQSKNKTNVTKKYTLAEARLYTLGLLNQARKNRGLEPLLLINNSVAQDQAVNLGKNKIKTYLGANGFKPYMRHTVKGNYNHMQENFAVNFKPDTDVQKNINLAVSQMLNNDSKNNLYNRNNILSKYHQEVYIGLYQDGKAFSIVLDFSSAGIKWDRPILYRDDLIAVAGTSDIGLLDHLEVYFDPVPQKLNKSSYELGDDRGTLMAYIVKEDKRVQGAKNIVAERWEPDYPGQFNVVSSINSVNRWPGVYTIVPVFKVGMDDVPLGSRSYFINKTG